MTDDEMMAHAAAVARAARAVARPNPWVGAVVADARGTLLASGATEAPGERHAEVVALDAVGAAGRGATLYVTLEPCAHTGRTPPCTERIVASGVARVVVAVLDPDARVSGRGVEALRRAGVVVDVGCGHDEVAADLAPYLHQRSTGRPYVVLKWAATLDGRTAAPDGTSRWITSEPARRDVHQLRADSDAVLVGAGTVRADDPELTVRLDGVEHQPLRVVLGDAPRNARVHPCLEFTGELEALLDDLGARGVLQLLVEGGASVAHEFLAQGLVNRVVAYVAPTLLGGDDGAPVLRGAGAPTIELARRGRFVSVATVGEDLRVELEI
ncbi:MAG TPA: bifunctional diaminohydroxyphosphoribosylaminopyrimidine deaminase/5-amino-6-(5-phosphoribosylamino)uracil reductase RibD [Acidimicrobiales bacterium]|nr:bifunctional diaminohydroxyphosphoribosylaminopyrimidine deaminase/5-amino-6-(5-phosphoribosylamino)uracil reductase RibD [Acidimicrobiales bacterium]